MKKIEDELYESYFKYARHVIEGRALPHVFDGLKDVNRRIIFSMFNEGITHEDKFKKCAKIVGDVLGKYHPHGEQSVYSALVRMAQDFNYRHTIIHGQGNFGSIDGDNAAATRYTEAKLAKYASEFFTDFNEEIANMRPNYDGTLREPVFLPTRIPNLLINGSHGIAVGISTSIPTHNLGEVIDALLLLLKNPDASFEDVMKFIIGPDLPGGGIIAGKAEIINAYRTGEGNVSVRSGYFFEDDCIVFNEVPYMVQKGDIMQQLATNVHEGRIEGVVFVRDESDRDGIRVVVKVKNGYAKEIVINQIYASTSLKTGLRFCLFALNEKGEPKLYSLMEYLKTFIKFREDVIITRTTLSLDKTKRKMHLLIGLSIAIENLNEIIEGIKKCGNSGDARIFLNSKKWKCLRIKGYLKSMGIELAEDVYELSPEQTKGILDLKLNNLVQLEINKIENELTELRKNIELCNLILNSKEKRIEIMEKEFTYIRETYSNPRRTIIEDSFVKFTEKDLVTLDDIIIILDKNNYIKRVSLSAYKIQNKGGKGRSGAIENIAETIIATTHSLLLMFSDKGIVYVVFGYQIPEGDHHTKGRAIVNLVNIDKDEQIIKFLVVSEEQAKNSEKLFLLFVCDNGQVRRNSLDQFINIRSNGKKYMSEENFNLISVLLVEDSDLLFMATRNGMAACTHVSEFRTFGSRDSTGVIGCRLRTGDIVIGAISLKTKQDLILTVTENGIGKISSAEDYRISHRGGLGVINMKLKAGNRVVDVVSIKKNDEVLLITQESLFMRFSVNQVNIIGRNTLGIKLGNINKGDKVIAIKKIIITEDEEMIENI